MKLFRSKKSVPSRRLADREPRPDEFASNQFRRNRTLSGVRPEPVAEGSPRAKVHHLTRQRRKVGSILLLVLLGIGILLLLMTQFTSKVLITTSSTQISSPIDASIYEEVINKYLAINPAGRLRFILNEQELSDYAVGLTPEVKSIAQTGAHNVVETRFAVTFREPLAGWQINNRQYYVDDHGVVFEKNYYQTPSVQIVDESGISPEEGSIVASARLLSFVGRAVGLAREGGYEVTQAVLPSGTTRQIEIRLKDRPTAVKLSIDRGVGEQIEDMVRSLRFLTSKGQTPSYIDVRVSGRAVYQ